METKYAVMRTILEEYRGASGNATEVWKKSQLATLASKMKYLLKERSYNLKWYIGTYDFEYFIIEEEQYYGKNLDFGTRLFQFRMLFNFAIYLMSELYSIASFLWTLVSSCVPSS